MELQLQGRHFQDYPEIQEQMQTVLHKTAKSQVQQGFQ
jgi:hypothetical protein